MQSVDQDQFSQDFYIACQQARFLDVRKSDDRECYTDFSQLRGGEKLKTTETSINRYSPNNPTCYLFTGNIGCGKSTELLMITTTKRSVALSTFS